MNPQSFKSAVTENKPVYCAVFFTKTRYKGRYEVFLNQLSKTCDRNLVAQKTCLF